MYELSNLETLPSPNKDQMYLQSRPGDYIYCPFECDECSFYRLTGYRSQHDNHTNKKFLDYIWRANLDTFWSCTQGTLYNITCIFSEEVTTGQNMGFQMFPTSPGPFPTYYDEGLQAALGVLTRSNHPGKHEAKKNISSACKARSVHANIYMDSASGRATPQVICS